jgi:uncharacterized protein (TIGR03083 family)
MPELRIELAPAAAAIERAGRRVAELFTHAEEPDRGVRGLEWTLGHLATHLAARTQLFAAYLAGTATPEGEIAGIAEENRRHIRERRDRPFAAQMEEMRSNVSSFVATTRGKLGTDPFPWYSELTLDVATASGLLLGELLVHGLDAARTLGRPWPIAANDARTIIRAAAALAPWYVDTEATRGDRCSAFGSTTAPRRSNPRTATPTARSEPTPQRWSSCRTGGSRCGERSRRGRSLRRAAARGGPCGSSGRSSPREPPR